MKDVWGIIKKYWLIETILSVAMVGLIVFWITGPKTDNQTAALTPTLSQNPTPTPPPAAAQGYGPFAPGESTDQITQHILQQQQNNNDYPLAGLLPYKTDLFTIDHYRDVRLLVVVVKQTADEKITGQLVGQWLVKNGYPANSHKIVWEIAK